MTMKITVKDRIAKSIAIHGRSELKGIYMLYPHISSITFMRYVLQLQKEGRIVIKKEPVNNGFLGEKKYRYFLRTKKNKLTQISMYEQE